jgi:ABC-type multidrug transport system fused ATPase/permease subunit
MSKSRRESELSQMKYFWRALKMVWPHRRYVMIAMISMVGVATAYTFSIATLYPILQMLLKKENPQDMVAMYIVESRLDVNLARVDVDNPSLEQKVGRHGYIMTVVKEKGHLYKEGVRIGDYLASVEIQKDPTEPPTLVQGPEMIGYLANRPDNQPVKVNVYSPGSGTMRSLSTEYEKTKWYYRAMLKAVGYVRSDYMTSTQPGGMDPRLKMLIMIMGCLVIFGIIGNFCRFLGEYYGSIVGARTLIDIRRKMYATVMMLPMSFFVSRGVSDTMSRFMQDSQDVLKALKTLFGKVLREPLKAIGALIVAIKIEPGLTLILIILAPLAGVLFRKFGKWIRRANAKMLIGYGQLIGALESTLSGIRVVKAYTMENRERKRYFCVEREILRQNIRIEKVNAMTSPILETLGTFALAGGVIWVFAEILNGSIDASSLLVLLVAMAAIMDPVRKLSPVYTDIQRANAAAKRIYELIDLKTEFELSSGTQDAFEPRKAIEFKDVVFCYPNSDHPALDHIDLTIEAGKAYAVVGPNGSGKTTLASLILRFFDPQSGMITWDGIDATQFRLRSLRRNISYVSQDAVIFADTVYNNIAYGNVHATMDQIISAAKQAHAHDFIERLPQKYNTVLGEHGTSLSGGERQRLAIARAILRNASVLIFDEATSQIDADSEYQIQQAIDKFLPGRTAIIIAHRFSTIKKADKIVVMDRGKIVACGSHQELIDASPLYQSLYQTQLKGLQQ